MVDSTTLVEEIRLILERELPDPWQDATKKLRNNYIYTNDVRPTGDFPKVLVIADDTMPTKLSWGGKTAYREKFVTTINVIYYNKRGFKYFSNQITYQDGSNTSQSLNQYMLKKVHDILKVNADKISAAKLRFGTISSTAMDGDTYYGFIPISLTYNEWGKQNGINKKYC